MKDPQAADHHPFPSGAVVLDVDNMKTFKFQMPDSRKYEILLEVIL